MSDIKPIQVLFVCMGNMREPLYCLAWGRFGYNSGYKRIWCCVKQPN